MIGYEDLNSAKNKLQQLNPMGNKNSEKGSALQHGTGFVLHFLLKACAFVLWVMFKLIGGIVNAITSALENYLDI